MAQWLKHRSVESYWYLCNNEVFLGLIWETMFCFSSSLLKYSDYSEKYVLFAKLYYNIKKNEFSGKLKKIGKMQLYN